MSAGVPALSPERPVVWPRRAVHRLANGLQVVLVESRTIPKISGQLLFRSGDAAAARVAPGLAEITAAVVRTGTESRNSRRIEEDLRRIGADLSVSAGTDSSAVSFTVLAEFAGELLELVADLVQRAAFPEAEFERERRHKLEEVKLERTTPGFLSGERLRKSLYGAHPYAQVFPGEADVEGYRREQLQQFYRENYVAANALLILVGHFEPPRLLAQVEKSLGSWAAGRPWQADASAPPAARSRAVHVVHFPGAEQAQVLCGHLAITRSHPDWLPLTLANSILGGAFNSRLVRNLREEKGYTYSPRSSASSFRDLGHFSVHAAVRSEVVAATLAEIFSELDRMRAEPVGDEELADARNYLSGVFSLGLATQEGLVGQLATQYFYDLPEDYLESYREKIRALSAADVLRAAGAWFDSANSQIVVVGERGAVAGQAAQFGAVEFYDAQGNAVA